MKSKYDFNAREIAMNLRKKLESQRVANVIALDQHEKLLEMALNEAYRKGALYGEARNAAKNDSSKNASRVDSSDAERNS